MPDAAVAKIIVTGASGNVGSALLRRLAQWPEPPEITGVARRIPPARGPYLSARWCRVDLAEPESYGVLRRQMSGADAVVHLAWGFQPSHRREYLRRTAVEGTRAVYSAAADAGVPHVLHMSSGAAYSPGSYGRPVDESWPTTGIPGCAYSVDKVAAERVLDELSGAPGAPDLLRLRPGFIGQYAAGSGLARYVLPDAVPSAITRHVPVLPVDRRLTIPAVHADDVAAAIDSALRRRAVGAVNLASPVPVGAEDFAAPFGCSTVHVPARLLSAVADAGWHARLQPVQGSWVDLAYATPMLGCERASAVLGWAPRHSGPAVWAETIAGMRARGGTCSPVLRARTARELLAVLVGRGPIGRRIPP